MKIISAFQVYAKFNSNEAPSHSYNNVKSYLTSCQKNGAEVNCC